MRSFLPIILAALVTVPAAAQTKPHSAFEGDPRLDKRVTVHWKKETLYDALQELSKKTGAHLAPDRPLADEPMMVSATNVPARQVLEQVGKLFHYTWARTGGTAEKPNYLVYQDKAAAQEEQDQIDGARRAVLEALNKELERYRRISKMPQDQVDRELEKGDAELNEKLSGGLASLGSNPAFIRRFQDLQAMRTLASPIGRGMMAVLDRITPGQWAELEDDERVTFSSSPGKGELKLPDQISDEMRQAKPTIPVPRQLLKSLGPDTSGAIDKVEGMMQEQWGRGNGFRVTVQLNLNLGSQPIGLLRVNPEPLGIQPEFSPIFAATGLNIAGAPQLLDEPKEDPMLREARLAADPVLGKKAKLKLPPLPKEKPTGIMAMLGNAYRSADVIAPLEEAFGVRIVSDAYNRQAMNVVPPMGDAEVPLYKVLDTIAGVTRTWDRDGDVIRIRSKTWAHDRRGEIPVRYMKRWLDIRAKKDGLSLDDIAEIASLLKDEQVESLMYSAMEAGANDFTEFVMIGMNRDILRFYAKLIPAQRKILASGQMIRARDLFPYQQKALLQLGNKKGQSMFASFMGGGKPARQPAEFAQATISLEQEDIPRDAPGANNPAVKAFGVGAPGGTVKITVAFGGGQKDDFNIVLFRPSTQTGGVQVAPGAGGGPPGAPAPAPSAPPKEAP